MEIVSVDIDLAKYVFAVHGFDESGKPTLVRPTVPRPNFLELIDALPPCLVGMEVRSGAHHWAREFAKLGHAVCLCAHSGYAARALARSWYSSQVVPPHRRCRVCRCSRALVGWLRMR